MALDTDNPLSDASVLVAGLLQDMITGGPLGLWGLTYLMVHFFMDRGAPKMSTRLQAWTGFVLVIILAQGINLLSARIVLGAWPHWQILFGQAFVILVLYPLCAPMVSGLTRTLVRSGTG